MNIPAFCVAVNTFLIIQLEIEQSEFLAIINTRYSRPGVRLNTMLVSIVVIGDSTPSSTGLPSVGKRLRSYVMLLAAQTTGGGFQLICTVPFAIGHAWTFSGGSC